MEFYKKVAEYYSTASYHCPDGSYNALVWFEHMIQYLPNLQMKQMEKLGLAGQR